MNFQRQQGKHLSKNPIHDEQQNNVKISKLQVRKMK